MTGIKKTSTLTFVQAFKLTVAAVHKSGALNLMLGMDTRLFIDPLLLEHSAHAEFKGAAVQLYEKHFDEICRLLMASKRRGDVAWVAASQRFDYPEIHNTSLGYGKGTNRGSGMGERIRQRLLSTAKEIVDMGVTDPTIFPLLGLLEKDVGADRISDMTTNIILPAILQFTERVCSQLKVPVADHEVRTRRARLPMNPLTGEPVLLVAHDVLRSLPIANDWDDVAEVVRQNHLLRQSVNAHIVHLLAKVSARNKAELRSAALSSPEAVQALIAAVKATAAAKGPDEYSNWADIARELAAAHPISLSPPSSQAEATSVVAAIIDQFRDLIENKGLASRLYNKDGSPRYEYEAQALFYAVAESYCKANNLDVTPEADHGRGPVDFKFSKGFAVKMVVEIKLSTNSKLVAGYKKQLEIYKAGAGTDFGYYVVIDVGKMGKKATSIVAHRNLLAGQGKKFSVIEFVNGEVQASASTAKP